MNATVRQRLTEILDDVDFPATRETLVEHADRREADAEVIGLLLSLPLTTFRNASEVRDSVPLEQAQSMAESR